jgi:hypothetical protein
MKLSALVALRIVLASGFIAPLGDALSQQSPSPGPVHESSPEPNKVDNLVQLQQKVANNRQNAPDIVVKAIQSDPQHSIFYAGEVVRYALRGLGSSISEAEISFLIAAAVNAVAAAVAEVPDPYEQVIVVHRREGSPEAPKSIEKSRAFITDKAVVSDGKFAVSDAGKAVVTEGKEPVGPEVISFEPSDSPDSMTLAEAIVLAALEGGSTAGLGTLMDSVNIVLLSLTFGAWNPANSSTPITKSPPSRPTQTPPPTPPPVSP